jgi:hypothetical protein
MTKTLPILTCILLADHLCLADAVQFNRDIRPILSENCFHCHGPDPGSRKAGLRLDTKEGFFEKTEKRGPTVLVGNAKESPLYQRVIETDPDEIMPPPEVHKELKAEQKELLKRWIDEGAPWQPHWSFIKPTKPAVPAVEDKFASWKKNPIDAFILEKLRAVGLEPAPEADKASLARRASYDLTGLPPKPEQVEAFEKDASPDAWEKYIDSLLAAPQWGEHRGRYWLDAARYADTHGLHFDNYREMWPYRDWVIKAFNDNMPFDQFTLEQIAGDLLPNPTQNQIIATGFHRCNITTNEGGTIEEENLVGYARDRAETTSWVWLGLTSNCAVCHDHKFDPIPTKDFYKLTAYFRNTQQGGLDGNVKDSNPSIIVPLQEDANRYEMVGRELGEMQGMLKARKKEGRGDFDKWHAAATLESMTKIVVPQNQVLHVPLNEGKGNQIVVNDSLGEHRITAPVKWDGKGNSGGAYTIVKGESVPFPTAGDFEKDQPFTVSLWVKSDANRNGALVGKMETGADGFTGWDVWLTGGDQISMHLIDTWPSAAIKVTTGKVLSRNKWHHVVVTYDGSSKAQGIQISVDGASQPLNMDSQTELKGTVRNAVPFRIGGREGGESAEKASVQDVRVFKGVISNEDKAMVRLAPDVLEVMNKAQAERTPEQLNKLQEFYYTNIDPISKDSAAKLIALQAEQKAIEARGAYTHVQRERTDRKPVAHVLTRGNYDQKAEEVTPGPFTALHSMAESTPTNRLGLAQWLLNPENPLTTRVTVNRFWQEVFGVGIVKTAEDFGIVGDAPSHPELLDWLAVEFTEQKWDIKKFFKLMLTSQAYRQAVASTPVKMEKDQFNRLLSRGPRFRMDAEMVRDTALSVSGLLVGKLGGKSVRPYQPPGVWEAVAMPESNTRFYKADSGESLYRRSLYTFWKRAAPPASMEIFNATAREVSCLRRERSNTPMQALVTMNDVQFMEAARVLATQVLKSVTTSDVDRLQAISRRVLSRLLTAKELPIVQDVLTKALEHYNAQEADAKALVTYGESPLDATVDAKTLAAWTMVANNLLNLDEALNK